MKRLKVCVMLSAALCILSFTDTWAESATVASSAYGKIVFCRQKNSVTNEWNVYTMNRDGSGETALTSGFQDRMPHFNPQGTKIVFSRITGPQSSICVMNSDGSGVTSITSDPSLGGMKMSPRFSSDGSKVVFDRQAGPNSTEIWTVNTDGTDPVRIVPGTYDNRGASFSPDGQWVVYSRYLSPTTAKVCKARVSDGAVTELTDGATMDEMPVYSPDGKYIIYQHEWNIYRMPADHLPGDQTTLVNLTGSWGGSAGYQSDAPMYSIEGDSIVFMATNDHSGNQQSWMNGMEIWMMNSDGSGRTRITSNSVPDFDPSCSKVAPTLTLTSPKGSETFVAGKSVTITWNGTVTGTVKIEYSTDDGVTWTTVSFGAPATGSYAWTVPQTASAKCRMRVSDTLDPGVSGVSAGTFSIVLPIVTVTSPNGGETWTAGSPATISWSSANVDSVRIEYSSDGGISWAVIAQSVPASAGSCARTAPDVNSSNCLIRVTDISWLAIPDRSDAVFTIMKELLPPSGLKVSDVPDDQGHTLRLTWTASPSELDGMVSVYRIFRSRLGTLTDPIPLARFAALDSLLFYEQRYTILVDSVSAGTTGYVDSSVPLNGTLYYYWVQAAGKTGASKPVTARFFTVVEADAGGPCEFRLEEAHPNPFNPRTVIEYSVSGEVPVTLSVYTVTGQRVAVLARGKRSAGMYSVVWDACGLPSGMYFVTLRAGRDIATRKAMLLK